MLFDVKKGFNDFDLNSIYKLMCHHLTVTQHLSIHADTEMTL